MSETMQDADKTEEVEIIDELAGISEDRMIAVCCPSGISKDDPPMSARTGKEIKANSETTKTLMDARSMWF